MIHETDLALVQSISLHCCSALNIPVVVNIIVVTSINCYEIPFNKQLTFILCYGGLPWFYHKETKYKLSRIPWLTPFPLVCMHFSVMFLSVKIVFFLFSQQRTWLIVTLLTNLNAKRNRHPLQLTKFIVAIRTKKCYALKRRVKQMFW